MSLAARADEIARADRLFRGRDDTANLRQAISVLEGRLTSGKAEFAVLWRLAKYRYYLSCRARAPGAQAKLLKSAIRGARATCRVDAQRPEGHFWLAVSYGEYADLKGAAKALKLLPAIQREYEAVLAIDPRYENGAAYEALGELDIRLPPRLGGNTDRGLERLEHGLSVAPTNADLKVTLARAYAGHRRKEEARRLLEQVLASRDPLKSAAEQEHVNAKARRLLDELRSGTDLDWM